MQENRYEDEETEMRLQQLESQQAAAPRQGGGIPQSSIEQLKQLAELRQQGVLTDAEFELQKQKLLQVS